MIENNPSDVASAFEILLEEIEAEIEFINRVGAKAFQMRDYDKAREALQMVEQITAFRNEVATLRKKWSTLQSTASSREDDETRVQRRNTARLRKGVRTPESAYYAPILQALESMGGRGSIGKVLARVEQLMKANLKPVNYEPLASDPDMLRNSAQWARNAMVQEGLPKADSPRGIWEISENGRNYLRRSKSVEEKNRDQPQNWSDGGQA